MAFDNDGPGSLIDVARHMLSIHDDLLDDDEDVADLDDEMALEIIRREYVSGTCGAFAIALHDLTGYPLIGMNGGLHIAVVRPDGHILDFMGNSPVEDVARRYGMDSPAISTWTRQEVVDHVLMGEEEGDPWDDISMARWVMRKLGRWG